MVTETRTRAVEILARVADLVISSEARGDGPHPGPEEIGTWRQEDLVVFTKKQLLEVGKELGLTGLVSLRKQEMAHRIQNALHDLADSVVEEEVETEAPTREDVVASAKYDLGPEVEEPPVDHIPWGYGHDRITAMAINPDQMYIYWEVTDGAIDAARRELGAGGGEAWLNIRVYDVSDRIFDGTNAHSYFDIKVERSDRQWFVEVGKPTSTHCVEIGLKSFEGFFVKIARSGRVEFPRREPVRESPVTWLTVRASSMEVAGRWEGPPTGSETGGGGWSPPSQGGGGGEPDLAPPTEQTGQPESDTEEWGAVSDSYVVWHHVSAEEQVQDWLETREWVAEQSSFEWFGPSARWSWTAGPFPLQVAAPGRVEEHFEGGVTVYSTAEGKRVSYGPWQVVIRGVGGWAEGRVLGSWEVHKSWATASGTERWSAMPVSRTGELGGASELGASERRWIVGSELRLGGASEVHLMGASELRYGGASEMAYRGASELRYKGASEYLYRGASEERYLGGSERVLLGGSEMRFGGGSEGRLGGASERRWRREDDEQSAGGDEPPPWPRLS